jgi:hypothetical protein
MSKKLYPFFSIAALITTIALILFMAEVPVIKWVKAYISGPLVRIYPEWKQKRNKNAAALVASP